MTDKVACRTPTTGRDGVTNIPAWKFDLIRDHVLSSLATGPMTSKNLQDSVRAKLSRTEIDELGSLGWHLCTVRLEMEVRGEIARDAGKGPLKLRLVE